MVKTNNNKNNGSSSDKHNVVPPYKKFKMDLKISKNKPFGGSLQPIAVTNNNNNNNFNVSMNRLPRHVTNHRLNNHHNPIHSHIRQPHQQQNSRYHPHQLPALRNNYHINNNNNNNNNFNDDTSSLHSGISRHSVSTGVTTTTSSSSSSSLSYHQQQQQQAQISSEWRINENDGMVNPFNDPPPNCTELDVRWLWRKQLEERRGHIRNRKFYSNYVGSKKSRKFYVIRTSDPNGSTIESSKTRLPSMYCGNHHLKHLVKIGCPKHDLFPILHNLNYIVTPSICTHKSHICPTLNNGIINNGNDKLLGSISMKNVGLIFKRNAFSTSPLSIEYTGNIGSDDEKNSFRTEIYVKRIANTNFSKAFRPGSYGKLQSLKKGSWKEGKIFYVFENDQLKLDINNNLYITFDLRSCASNSDNEQNTIDGWKNIVGGVGFYRPPETKNVCSVLVLRKHPNFPLECLQNSTIKIYSKNNNNNINGKLYIGSQIFDLDTTSITNVVDSSSDDDEQDNYHGGNQNIIIPNMMMNNNNGNNRMVFTNDNNIMQVPQSVATSPPPPPPLPQQQQPPPSVSIAGSVISSMPSMPSFPYQQHINMDNNNDIIMSKMRKEYELRFHRMQQELLQKNNQLQTLNMQLMQSNTNLQQDNQQLTSQVHELQSYMSQQHQQITKLVGICSQLLQKIIHDS